MKHLRFYAFLILLGSALAWASCGEPVEPADTFIRLDSTWLDDSMYVTIDGDRLDTVVYGDTIQSCGDSALTGKLFSLSKGRHELKVFDKTELNQVWAIFRYNGSKIRVSGYSSIIDSTEMKGELSGNCLSIRIARKSK